jgi:hypothetical protein
VLGQKNPTPRPPGNRIGSIVAGRERFQMDLVLLGIPILGFVGFAINRGASAIETRLPHWRPTRSHSAEIVHVRRARDKRSTRRHLPAGSSKNI